MNKRVNKKNDIREAHIYFPVDVYERLKQMAATQRRTINGEVILAVEDRLNTKEKNND
jgi:hypothetical protein